MFSFTRSFLYYFHLLALWRLCSTISQLRVNRNYGGGNICPFSRGRFCRPGVRKQLQIKASPAGRGGFSTETEISCSFVRRALLSFILFLSSQEVCLLLNSWVIHEPAPNTELCLHERCFRSQLLAQYFVQVILNVVVMFCFQFPRSVFF